MRTPSAVESHEALNLTVFENLVATIEDPADLIPKKICGVGSGGGNQVRAAPADLADMEVLPPALSDMGRIIDGQR